MLYQKYLKPFLDFVVALLGFVILSPLFVVVVILLFIANDGKPFFFQLRPGLHEKIFKVIKFKTMNDKKDKNGNLLPDSERLTRLGQFIRKTSLDEIPQLLNVIKGDMSLIGPRPLLIKYLPYFTQMERKRFTVKPGITGWAQVNGRNNLDWDKRFKLDVYYVENLSFKLDIIIIIKTLKNIVTSEGIVVDPRALMSDLDIERKDTKNGFNKTYH